MRPFKISLEEIDLIASSTEFRRIDFQENIAMASYWNGKVRINIYLTKMTIATCLRHPKKGATQLFRRNVNKEILKQIFANPRKHTGLGYYEK